MKNQTKIEWSLEDLLTDCYKLTADSYYEISDTNFQRYREIFFVDALLIANIGGLASREVLRYIADLCSVLGIPKERLRPLSLLATDILKQNFDEDLDEDLDIVLTEAQKCKFYFINPEIITEGIVNRRKIVVKVKDEKLYRVGLYRWTVKQMQKVELGDIVFEYATQKSGYPGGAKLLFNNFSYSGRRIKATSNGTIFQFRYLNTNYGVIAHETDDREAIKEWVKAGE